MPDPTAKPLGYLLKRAQHALRTRMDEALHPLALTTPQYSVLSAVELQPGISNAALARTAFVTAQTMQGIVVNLERAGLLQRKPDPDHGRIQRGELTLQGQAVLREAHTVVAKVQGRMTAGLDRSEVEFLSALLARCADHLTRAPRDEGSEPMVDGKVGV